jgi:hypothetical protein
MEKMSRRAMLWATSAGVATLSGVTAVLVGTQREKKAEAAAPTTTGATATGSLALYVKDVSKGRVSVMMGEQEVVLNNPDLVRQILKVVQ